MPTARKLPSGNYRALVYDYTDQDGKRRYRSFTAPTRREAEFLATQFALDKKEKAAQPAVPDYTLAEAINAYCDLKSNVLSPATLREYRRMQRNSYGWLADLPLKEINSDTVQRWINERAKTHAPKTVRNDYGLISAVMETFAFNTRLRVTLPQRIPPTPHVPSNADVKTLLAYFAEHDKNMELAVYLAAFGTLRRSEICALTAEDVHDDVISVNKALVMNENREWVTKTTKTVSSARLVELPHFVVEKFPLEGRIVPITPERITKQMQVALKRLGIPSFRFHDLRHYAASIMHAIGIPDQYIMQRCGWSSDSTLKAIYRGTIEEYTQKYTDIALAHFETMQHEMQHKK